MANVIAKLRCLDLKGETVNTRWGAVKFDRDGLADLDVPEEELPMLRAIQPFSWLAEDQLPVDAPAPPVAPQASQPAPASKSRK